MIKDRVDALKAARFGDFIKNKTNYIFMYKSLSGPFYGLEPWINENKVDFVLSGVSDIDKIMAKFFLFSENVEYEELKTCLGIEYINFLLDSGYAYIDGKYIIPDNYVLIPIRNKLFVVNPPYRKFRNGKKVPDLYVGADSLKLINFVKTEKGLKILDLCSGVGIIGISLIDHVKKVDFIEIREDVIDVLKFNIAINNIPIEKVGIINSDIFNNMKEEKYDYIVTNPPFVPTPDGLRLPVCGAGGKDGLDIIRRILADVTKYMNINGRLYMVLEAIGDEKHPLIVDLFADKFNKGTINISLFNRQLIEEQARVSSLISSDMFGEKKNIEFMYEEWMKAFREIGATYVYPTLVEYIYKNNDLVLNIFKKYEDIDRTVKYRMKDGVKIEEVKQKMYRIITNDGKFSADDEMIGLIGDGNIVYLNDVIEKNTTKYFEYIKILDYLIRNSIIETI